MFEPKQTQMNGSTVCLVTENPETITDQEWKRSLLDNVLRLRLPWYLIVSPVALWGFQTEKDARKHYKMYCKHWKATKEWAPGLELIRVRYTEDDAYSTLIGIKPGKDYDGRPLSTPM